MLSEVYQFLTSLVGPAKVLREAIHNYEEKKEIKKELADAFEMEGKEFEEVSNEFGEFGKKTLPLLLRPEGQLSPRELLEFLGLFSQVPRILAKLIVSFVHMAKACKEISNQKGFMDSLCKSDRFTHDLIDRIGSTYVEKDTVIIDGSFFRFFRMNKRRLLKGMKPPKINGKEIKIMQRNAKSILHSLNDPFLQRHMRHPAIKKWKSSFAQLYKVSQEIQVKDVDNAILEELVSADIREFAPFLDKSP